MNYTSISVRGSQYNEDAVFINEKYGFVIDGASGLYKEKISDAESDAQWFSNAWKDYLKKELADEKKDLSEIFRIGIARIDKRYSQMEGADSVKMKPSAGIAVFRIVENIIQYFILGDCSIMFVNANGLGNHIHFEALSILDNANISAMVRISREKNIHVVEARSFIKDSLVNARLKQNQPNGYWSLSDSLVAIDNALTGEIPICQVKHIILMSDGFSQIFDTLNICTKEELAKKVASGISPKELCGKIKTVQDSDPFCNKYPRFKKSDDTTVAIYSFD